MKIVTHQVENSQMAEVISDEMVMGNIQQGIDLLGDLYYQGFDKIIIHQKNITPDFFDLSSGIAGEILQKFSNYRVRCVIVGDFSIYTSKSLKDFIFESNKVKQVNFVNTVSEAIQRLSE